MTMLNNFPPALLFLAGALLLPLIPRKLRSTGFIAVTLLSLVMVALMPEGVSTPLQAMGYSLTLCKVDAMSRIFGLIFAFVALAGGIYALQLKELGQQVAALIYGAGALGVTFAGDLFTLFIFWELMAVSSVYLVWAKRDAVSYRAGLRYLLYHILGGGLLFSGILVQLQKTGDLSVSALSPDQGLGAWLMLAGVAVNAAITPLHTWLTDAYPKATITGAVFMSAFTTKSAVYVLARIFPGWEILLYLGVVMAIYGVIYAIMADDMREILSYHIVCQVGYMVAAIGIGSAMAVDGAIAHAVNNILFKTLMFMAAGTVMYFTGQGRLSRLGGLFSAMPLVFALYMIGGLSISGVPLFNGFVSKSLIVAAATEAHLDWVVLGLLLASIGTFISVGLKLPYFCWLAGRKGEGIEPRVRAIPLAQPLGMLLLAVPCLLFGVYPSLLNNLLPAKSHVHAYSASHLSEMGEMLVLAFAAFWFFKKKLTPKAAVLLDLDWFYRRFAKGIRWLFVELPDRFFDAVEAGAMRLAASLARFGRNPLALLHREEEYSPDAYRATTQGLTLVLLAVFVIITMVGFWTAR